MRPLLALLIACKGPSPDSGDGLSFVAATFNTGTSEGMPHDQLPDDGYGSEQAAISDQYYGDGLAWKPVVDDTVAFLTAMRPDVIGFQEIFDSEECAGIPPEGQPGFVCEDWSPGDPTVAQVILGEGYQIACHQGKSDKCLAVNREFAEIRGCDRDVCRDFLDGAEIDGCGSGSRIGRATLDLVDGSELVVVNVHGSSGLDAATRDCRVQQFRTVFEDLDGQPAANGKRNVVLGDFNTDPGRAADGDESAAYLWDQVTGNWGWITDIGPEAEPTYIAFNIDHVFSDAFDGACEHAGIGGLPLVSDVVYFDHMPAICNLTAR